MDVEELVKELKSRVNTFADDVTSLTLGQAKWPQNDVTHDEGKALETEQ